MNLALEHARAIRDSVRAGAPDVYTVPDDPGLIYDTVELEALLRAELTGEVLSGPLRTRSKLAKEVVCRTLGYPVPAAFRRVRPRLPSQDLDVYVQQHDNLQVWNEELSPTRRYALIRVDSEGTVTAVRVVEGAHLVPLDKTGTLTSKYQAKRRSGSSNSRLVSEHDTPNFVSELEPVSDLAGSTLAVLHPSSRPRPRRVFTIASLYDRLSTLVGQEFEYSSSERLRGERLHRLACEALGLGSYADTGKFPDIVCQAVEVKLQTAGTIDLGLVSPDSTAPAVTLTPGLVHADARYAVAYGELTNQQRVRIDHIVVSTGADFFSEFQRFEGLVQNRKLQLKLPSGFFEAEQLPDESV